MAPSSTQWVGPWVQKCDEGLVERSRLDGCGWPSSRWSRSREGRRSPKTSRPRRNRRTSRSSTSRSTIQGTRITGCSRASARTPPGSRASMHGAGTRRRISATRPTDGPSSGSCRPSMVSTRWGRTARCSRGSRASIRRPSSGWTTPARTSSTARPRSPRSSPSRTPSCVGRPAISCRAWARTPSSCRPAPSNMPWEVSSSSATAARTVAIAAATGSGCARPPS